MIKYKKYRRKNMNLLIARKLNFFDKFHTSFNFGADDIVFACSSDIKEDGANVLFDFNDENLDNPLENTGSDKDDSVSNNK